MTMIIRSAGNDDTPTELNKQTVKTWSNPNQRVVYSGKNIVNRRRLCRRYTCNSSNSSTSK